MKPLQPSLDTDTEKLKLWVLHAGEALSQNINQLGPGGTRNGHYTGLGKKGVAVLN